MIFSSLRIGASTIHNRFSPDYDLSIGKCMTMITVNVWGSRHWTNWLCKHSCSQLRDQYDFCSIWAIRACEILDAVRCCSHTVCSASEHKWWALNTLTFDCWEFFSSRIPVSPDRRSASSFDPSCRTIFSKSRPGAAASSLRCVCFFCGISYPRLRPLGSQSRLDLPTFNSFLPLAGEQVKVEGLKSRIKHIVGGGGAHGTSEMSARRIKDSLKSMHEYSSMIEHAAGWTVNVFDHPYLVRNSSNGMFFEWSTSGEHWLFY